MAIKVKELSQDGARAILQLDTRGISALVGDAERTNWNSKADPATVLQFVTNQSSNITALRELHQASDEPNVILKSGEKVYTLVRRETKADAGYDYVFDGGAETEYIVRYTPSTNSYTIRTRALVNNTNIAQNGSLPPSSTLVKQTLEAHTESKDVHITAAERTLWNSNAKSATVLQFVTNQSSNITALRALHQASGEPNVILKSGEKVYTLVRREEKCEEGYKYVFNGGAETEYVVQYIPLTNSYTLQTRALINNTNIAQNGSLPPSSALVKQALEAHTGSQNTFYGTCTTSTSTYTKTVNVGSGFTLRTGVMVTVYFRNAATDSIDERLYLNINNSGTYPIQYNNSIYWNQDLIPGQARALFIFDGSAWQLLNPVPKKESTLFVLSFSTRFVGKTFTITGRGFSGYSNVVPQEAEVTVGIVTTGQTYTVTCDGYTKTFTPTETNGQYRGYFNILSLNSWSEIAQASSNGMASKYWSVGDTINITCSDGQILTLQIYDFRHDDLASGTGKAGITFGLKNLMSSYRQMNTSDTSEGGFTGANLYNWMKQGLWNMLPADLRAVIKPVKKQTSSGAASHTMRTDVVSLFLFSQLECMGSVSLSVPGEGYKYPIFTDNNSRKKFLSNGAECPSHWWTRSPQTGNSSNFVYISSYGDANTFRASGYHGVCFGFCV